MADPIQSIEVVPPTDVAQTARVDALRVVVLGLNAWVVLVIIPWLLAGPTVDASGLWLVTPLTALLVGASLVLWHRHFATWLLLGVFPVLIAGVMAWMPRLTLHTPYATLGITLGAMSFVAFGAGAATAVGRPQNVREASRKTLGTVAPVEEHGGRRWGRRVLLVVTGTGAFALALVAPAIGDQAAYVRNWGIAADEGATLAAVLGGALGATLVALVVGPGLRASRARAPSARRSRRRALTMIGLSFVGLGLYAFYHSAR